MSDSLLEPGADARADAAAQLPWAYGCIFSLLAASQSLPMTANMQLIYRELSLTTEEASAFFLAEFLPSFATPVFAWLTDCGGPRVRLHTIVATLVLKAVAIAAFALGAVRSIGGLYIFGMLKALMHVIALATVDGAICARGNGGASGDTSAARKRQAVKLACQHVGDFAAAILSLILAAVKASLPVVYALTACVIGLAAACACRLPSVQAPAVEQSRQQQRQHGSQQEERPDARPPDPPLAVLEAPPGPAAEPALQPPPYSPPAHSSPTAPSPLRTALGAAVAALAVAIYMLPPTSGVAMGSYVGRNGATRAWVLSAQQLCSMGGAFLGIGLMYRLDLPLRRSLPLGALLAGAAQLTSLTVYAIGGDSNSTALDGTPLGLAVLVMEPVASSALGSCSVVAILSLAAAAAEGSGEGAAYGLVAAADAAGAYAAGSLSLLAVHELGIGNPPRGSWARLPLLVCACALCKLLAVPLVLLLLRLRERIGRGARSDEKR